KNHFQRRISLQYFLAVRVIESTPVQSENDQDIPGKVSGSKAYRAPVNPRAHDDTRERQAKTDPADGRHSLSQKNVGHECSTDRQRQHEEGCIAGQGKASAPGDEELSWKNPDRRKDKVK